MPTKPLVPGVRIIRVSKKWLRKHVDCTPSGRTQCRGRCCKRGRYGTFDRGEVTRLPEALRDKLEPVDGNIHRVRLNRDGDCGFLNICLFYPQYKPWRCWVAPLRFNRAGTLVLQRFCTLHCPNYGRGEEVWRSLKYDLIRVFGSAFYEALTRVMLEEGDDVTYVRWGEG